MSRKLVVVVAGLAVLQLAAVLIYRAVDRRRPGAVDFVAERLRGEPAPLIDVEGGSSARVPVPGKVVLVHFWATWCPPCREELPGLLALGEELARTGHFELHAVSVDDDWATIERYFGGRVPAGVVRAQGREAHRRYGVSTLPDSYLVDRDGRLVERFAGARDWRSARARAHLETWLAD